MKKKFIVMIAMACVLALGAFALVGCSQQGGGSADNSGGAAEPADDTGTFVESTLENNTLVVGFDAGYPPYGYIADDGSYTGFDLDLAAEVCARNGWEMKAEPIDWDAKDALLNQGTITCIWNGFTHEGREDQYAFSGDYMINAQVIVVKADSGIATEADLAGKTVITQVESAALDVLQGDKADLAATFAGGAPQTISDYTQAFMQLESGIVDAVACDLSIAAYYIANKPDVYMQLEPALSSEHYAVGFKLGDEALAAAVTVTLQEMDADGTVKTICDKYADQGISYENWCLE